MQKPCSIGPGSGLDAGFINPTEALPAPGTFQRGGRD